MARVDGTIPVRILALDPGSTSTGWVIYNRVTHRVIKAGNDDNQDMLRILRSIAKSGQVDVLAIECPELIGQANFQEHVLITAFWVGRFEQCWNEHAHPEATLITRREIKKHFLPRWNMPKADTAITFYLKQRFPAGKGTKKEPGPLFGVTSHAWQALAVGVAYVEMQLWKS